MSEWIDFKKTLPPIWSDIAVKDHEGNIGIAIYTGSVFTLGPEIEVYEGCNITMRSPARLGFVLMWRAIEVSISDRYETHAYETHKWRSHKWRYLNGEEVVDIYESDPTFKAEVV